MVTHPDGNIWFVQTKANGLGRIDRRGRVTEFPVATPDASLRGVAVAPDGDLWFTENFSNKIGRMAPDAELIGEYAMPVDACGARAIGAIPHGRLVVSAHAAAATGEVTPRRCHVRRTAAIA